jgi:hypothetical protein
MAVFVLAWHIKYNRAKGSQAATAKMATLYSGDWARLRVGVTH